MGWLRAKYLDEGMTTEEIGGLIGVASGTVSYHLRRHGIPARSKNEARTFADKACEVCGATFTPTGSAARYCRDCAPEMGYRAGREAQKRLDEREKASRRGPRDCVNCGAEFRGLSREDFCYRIECQQAAQETKRCAYCKELKIKGAFGADRSRSDRLDARCKDCRTDQRRRLAAARPVESAERARTTQQRYRLKKLGLTFADYERVLKAQGGMCAVCKRPPRDGFTLAFDHDHGHCPAGSGCRQCIRGLCCTNCNNGIGYLGDDAVRLRAAADYVESGVRPLQ